MDGKIVYLNLRWIYPTIIVSLMIGMPGLCRAQKDETFASHIAQLQARSLQMVLSDPSSPESERLIVWDTGFGDGQAAHIALCNHAGKCRWQHTWPEAYGSNVQYMSSWSTDSDFVFLVTYNEGAEAQTAVVIGLQKRQPPRVLAQEDGSWIAIAPQVNGLQVNTSSGLPPTIKCLRWDASRLQFFDVECH